MKAEFEHALDQLHSTLLKSNEHDESDLLYYRINYRLAESFAISNREAQMLHAEYHADRPRTISQGYCDRCRKLVTLVPIIYGIQSKDLPTMRQRELQGTLLVGSADVIRDGTKVPMFGCRECKSALPKFGTF